MLLPNWLHCSVASEPCTDSTDSDTEAKLRERCSTLTNKDELLSMMEITRGDRRAWITKTSQTVSDILQRYPRSTDVPDAVCTMHDTDVVNALMSSQPTHRRRYVFTWSVTASGCPIFCPVTNIFLLFRMKKQTKTIDSRLLQVNWWHQLGQECSKAHHFSTDSDVCCDHLNAKEIHQKRSTSYCQYRTPEQSCSKTALAFLHLKHTVNFGRSVTDGQTDRPMAMTHLMASPV